MEYTTQERLDDLEAARPYIHTFMALLVFILDKRPNENGADAIDRSYDTANQFILKLKEDVSAQQD